MSSKPLLLWGQAGVANILNDPGFEGNSLVGPDWLGESGWVIDATNPRSGTKCAKHTGATSSLYNPPSLAVALAVQPGQSYTAKGWYKGTGGADGNANIRMSWYQADNTPISDSTSGNAASDGAYHQLSVTGTAPALAAKMLFIARVTGQTAGSWFFDDAELQRAPSVWQTSPATSDGGITFVPLALSNHLAPGGLGGEAMFYWAHLTMSWSMAAQLRISPVLDGVTDFTPLVVTGGTIEVVRPIITLAQQPGSANVQRRTETFAVPLLKKLVTAGVERSRSALRGRRLALLLESIGTLGTGELILEACEIEHQVLSTKVIYAAGLAAT